MKMQMKTVNLPLLALFGLCYGLGHPSLANYRPAMVDKTLASFHTDLNRSVVAWSDDLAKVIFSEPQAASASQAANPAAAAIRSTESATRMAQQPARHFADVARVANASFTVLSAR
jgi:hypothetical protein